MNRAQKEALVEKMRDEFGQAQSIIMTSHVGIDVNTVNELRSEFRANGVHYHVVKNTLAKIAVRDTDLETLAEAFRGPTAVAYSFEDAVAPAKVIADFADDHDEFEVKGGYLNGEMIDVEQVEALAKMPSKDELRAQLLRTFMAAPTQLVQLFDAAPRQFVNVLEARKNDLESAA
ncbi:MAG: 50S ribosomal protein L10 [Persicimonas sp.]